MLGRTEGARKRTHQFGKRHTLNATKDLVNADPMKQP